MKTLVVAALVALGAVSVTTTAAPQREFVEARGSVKSVPLPPGGPTPRMADGHPDFSGVWFDGPTGMANAWSVDAERGPAEDPIPFQPWAAEKRKAMTRVELELSSANVNCTPVGTPGMFTDNAYAHQIVMKPGMFVHLIENNNRYNVVYIDGRPHTPKEELEPLFYGDQTAKWEGDTLVIDSISIDTRAQIRDGWMHSEELHVIERLRRPSMNYLEYQVTIEDPKVLTKPWTSAWETLSLSAKNERLSENFCTNNENVEQLRSLYEQQKGQK
ncbi:MAG: hypothetical protein HOP16_18180 [Acidobacteria bacterium]|nr:hypothetical protein [Acidobacteriota bacterium]